MKKFSLKLSVLLLCFIVAMPFTSCNSDERDAEKIIGKWVCVSSYDHEYESCVWSGDTVDPVCQNWDEESVDDYKAEFINFNEDGTYQSSCAILGTGGHYDNGMYYGKWSVLDDSLYIDDVWFIDKLTKSKLKVVINAVSVHESICINDATGEGVCTYGDERIREFKK